MGALEKALKQIIYQIEAFRGLAVASYSTRHFIVHSCLILGWDSVLHNEIRSTFMYAIILVLRALSVFVQFSKVSAGSRHTSECP